MPTPDNSTNKALDRAFYLLEGLAKDGLSLNVADISRYLGVTRVTAQSLVNSMEAMHYIEKNPENGRYSLGYRLFTLGNRYIYQYPFLHAAEKHINNYSLSKQIKVNVSVLKPAGYSIILLSKDLSLIPDMVISNQVPANIASSGKLLLAFTPEVQREEILKNMEFKGFTKYSITDPEVLRQQMEVIRHQGYATEIEELSLQRGCVAAPIRDVSGTVIAAVSLSTNVERLRNDREALVSDVLLLGQSISAELGFTIV